MMLSPVIRASANEKVHSGLAILMVIDKWVQRTRVAFIEQDHVECRTYWSQFVRLILQILVNFTCFAGI